MVKKNFIQLVLSFLLFLFIFIPLVFFFADKTVLFCNCFRSFIQAFFVSHPTSPSSCSPSITTFMILTSTLMKPVSDHHPFLCYWFYSRLHAFVAPSECLHPALNLSVLVRWLVCAFDMFMCKLHVFPGSQVCVRSGTHGCLLVDGGTAAACHRTSAGGAVPPARGHARSRGVQELHQGVHTVRPAL